jgi:PAS domain S-box-containing protein
VITFVDITERVNAERAQRESAEQFRALVDASAQMVWTTDAAGRVVEDSPTWRKFTGQTREQQKEWGWLDALHPEDRALVQENWQRAMQTQTSFANEYRVWHADSGEHRWTSVRAVPLKDGEGSIRGWIGMNIDVHDLKRSEASLLDADRRKNEFLATLAHELRNPLAPIRSGVELLSHADSDPQVVREVRSIIEHQVTRLVALVDDLLDVSRITRGAFTLRKRKILIDEVVQHAVEEARPCLAACRHRFRVQVSAKAAYVEADSNRLIQVLVNLLNNAAKYTPEAGDISLVVERENESLLLCVSDSGCGIAPDKVAQVFEMFARIEDDDRRQAGLGVGLTLAKQLVEMHGGTLEAASDGLGKGSRFTIRLPLCQPPAEPSQAPLAEHSEASPQLPLRVLIVDDNEDAARLLSMLVRKLGNDVRTASDGRQAIEVAEQFRPQVVLMDIGMPHMNGMDAARHIRPQPWGEGMKLVALTGWGNEEDRMQTREAGFDMHLVKPADLSALEAILATCSPPRKTTSGE